jgi:hypothetical protein
MSEFVEWIAAQAETRDVAPPEQSPKPKSYIRSAGRATARGNAKEELPAHNFPARPAATQGMKLPGVPEHDWNRDPDIWLYRKKTWVCFGVT